MSKEKGKFQNNLATISEDLDYEDIDIDITRIRRTSHQDDVSKILAQSPTSRISNPTSTNQINNSKNSNNNGCCTIS